MAFVKLRNIYGKEIKVSAGAVKSYRNLGFYPNEEFDENAIPFDDKNGEVTDDDFEIDEDKDEKSEDVKDDNKVEKSEEEIFVETISKKPLASWTKNEVKKYAAIFNIDLAGTKSADEAKERIKAFMSDAE